MITSPEKSGAEATTATIHDESSNENDVSVKRSLADTEETNEVVEAKIEGMDESPLKKTKSEGEVEVASTEDITTILAAESDHVVVENSE